MATYTKTKAGWRAQVCCKGLRVSKTLLSKAEAKHWAAQKELELNDGKTIASTNRRVFELFERYEREVSPSKKSCKWETQTFKTLAKFPLVKVFVDDLNSGHVAMWRDARIQQVMSSTVNRELNLISSVFTKSVKEWRWLKDNPVTDVLRPKNPNHRDRRVSDEELEQVLEGLGYTGVIETKNQLVAAYFLFALETAMRLGEICGLEGSDFQGDHVIIRTSKNGDKRYVPLSTKARALAILIKSSGLRTTSDSAGTMFRKVVKKQGIEDLHFHDSRHEGLTRLASKLTVLEVARMVGHRDLKSLMIYYNATPSELALKLD